MVEENKVKRKLLDGSEKCSALARLLRRSDRGTDADVLAQGSEFFSRASNSGVGAELAIKVLSQSFGEDGPRLPSLVRGIIALSQYREDHSTSSKEEVSPGTSGCCDIPQVRRIGNIKCVLDDGNGKYLATLNKLGSRWINNYSEPPFYFGRHGDFRYMSFSPYYKEQQIIAEAFFMQDGGALLLPTLADVFVSAVGEYKKLRCLYESRLFLFTKHFLRHAGQLVYKIRHIDAIQPVDYGSVTGLKKFEKIIDTVAREYKEVIGHPITTDHLVKVALREHTDLLSL